MKKSNLFILILLVVAMVSSCSDGNDAKSEIAGKDELKSKIDSVEAILFNASTKHMNNSPAFAIVKLYRQYAEQFPQDELAADYLFKAGEVGSNIGLEEQSVNFFGKVYENYPNYDKRVESLYLQAFLFETKLNNLEKAKEFYQKVIDNHPDHKLAQDAQAAIGLLGLSDEEIIKKFEEMNKQNQPS